VKRGRRVALLATVILLAGGCSQEPKLTALGERGRQVYQAQCIACHNPDPAKPGPIGPAVRGSSEELLRARVASGTYPPGYTPKRPTKLMQPMPQLAQDIPALAEYLK
jgi:mono/diheme cytochrome c family protein